MARFLDALLQKKSRSDVVPVSPQKAGTGAVAPPQIRLVFMGTPDLSAQLLSALLDHHYHVVGVVTQPDKPAGRKLAPQESPVKKVALKHGLPLLTPSKLDEAFAASFRAWKPDIAVVVAYGKILPPAVLQMPGFGCINLHASLLPRWRGASPIQNSLLAGDTETGVTLMQMDQGMDTGPIIAQKKIAIDPRDTAETLRRKIVESGQDLLLETLPRWIERIITPAPQDEWRATLCQLIERSDGRIIWSESAENIFNRYRALFPWPGIFAFWKKNDALMRLKLIEVTFQKQSPQIDYALGEVFELGEKVGVQTGEGVIFLETVQLEGKSPMPIKEFLAGAPEFIGSILH